MKQINITYLRIGILLFLLIVVFLFQNIEGWGDVYAQQIYPVISLVLSSFSNIFPFSIDHLFVTIAIIALVIYPFIARKKGKRWIIILFREVEALAWIYVWFYIAWGLNYSQSGILQKLNIQRVQYSEEVFITFSENYIEKLNDSYEAAATEIDTLKTWRSKELQMLLSNQITASYHSISSELAINKPQLKEPRGKDMLLSPLSSMVGVSGSMAPFFCEFTVNSDVLAFGYPATYAHEMAHQLGITNEAEANLYAYETCILSSNRYIRFSGYYSILRYVLGNARSTLSAEKYSELYKSINPEIMTLIQKESIYWNEKYSELLGEIQHYIYNVYLKSNKIGSGTKNYSEVVGMLIAIQEHY